MLYAARIDTDTETGTNPGRPEAPPTTSGGQPGKPGTLTPFTPTPTSTPPQPGKPVTFPVGAITTYSVTRRKWRIAVPIQIPTGTKPVVRTLTPMPTAQAPVAPIKRNMLGYDYGVAYALGHFNAATHVQTVEQDQPPANVKQVDEPTYKAAVGEQSASPASPASPATTTANAPVTSTSAAPSAPGSGAIPTTSAAPGGGAVPVVTATAPPFVPEGYPTAPMPAAPETQRGFFRVNNPWMWVAIASSVAAAGTGAYVIVRRKRGR